MDNATVNRKTSKEQEVLSTAKETKQLVRKCMEIFALVMKDVQGL